MSIEQFYQEINQLSDQVEALLEASDEQECAGLLSKRQTLLEQLAEQIAISDQSDDCVQTYQLFLKSIETRDKQYVNYIKQQTEALTLERKKQMKGRKAVKAYHNYRFD